MKYYKMYVGDDKPEEIDYIDALRSLLTTYKDNDITREMLTEPGIVRCRFSFIIIKDESEVTA